MRRHTFTATLCSLLLLVFTACSQNDAALKGTTGAPGNSASGENSVDTSTKTLPGDVVRVEAGKVEIKTGGEAVASVKLTIASGYHVNANPASFSYLIPTEVQLQTTDNVSAEKPGYPDFITKTFAFSKDPLSVYEGEVNIKIPLRAGSKAPKGDLKMSARVRVQPCDDNACYPPRTIETSIPVTIN